MIESIGKFKISRHHEMLLDFLEEGLKNIGFEIVVTSEPISRFLEVLVVPSDEINNGESEKCEDKCCHCKEEDDDGTDVLDESNSEKIARAAIKSVQTIASDALAYKYIQSILKKDTLTPEEILNNLGTIICGTVKAYAEARKSGGEGDFIVNNLANTATRFAKFIIGNPELKQIYISSILPTDENMREKYEESGQVNVMHVANNFIAIIQEYMETRVPVLNPINEEEPEPESESESETDSSSKDSWAVDESILFPQKTDEEVESSES